MLTDELILHHTPFQVNSSLAGSMPDIRFPPEFSRMSDSLSGAFNLDFVTETGEPNGSNPLNPTPTSRPNPAPTPQP